MSAAPEPRPSLDPESEEYQRLWNQGLRPRVIWVPDLDDPQIAAEIRRECRGIAMCEHEDESMDFIESVSVLFEDSNDTGRDRLS